MHAGPGLLLSAPLNLQFMQVVKVLEQDISNKFISPLSLRRTPPMPSGSSFPLTAPLNFQFMQGVKVIDQDISYGSAKLH